METQEVFWLPQVFDLECLFYRTHKVATPRVVVGYDQEVVYMNAEDEKLVVVSTVVDATVI